MKLSNITKYAKMSFVTLMSVSLVGIMGIFPATADAVATLQKIGAVSDVTLDAAFGVAVDEANNRAVVVSWKGQSLSVIDLSDKKNPVVIGSITSPDLKTASDVELDATGNFAYVTVAFASTSGLVTVDLSNPALPTITSVLNQAGALPIVVAGGIDREGSVIYVVTDNALFPFDIGTDPRTPAPLAPFVFDPAGALAGRVQGWDVSVSNGYAYITAFGADRFYAVQLVAVGGTIYSPGNGCGNPGDACLWQSELNGAIGVDVQGDFAYVTSYDANTFSVIDISNPTTPVIVSTLTETDSEAFDGPYDVSVDGNVAAVTSMNTGSVALINISNPTNPVVLSTYTNGSSGTDVAFYDGMIVTLDRNADDIAILDMIDDSNPSGGSSASGGSSIRKIFGARSSARSGARQRVDGGLLCPVNLNVSLGSVNEDVMRVKSIVAFTGDFSGSVDNDVYDQATADAVLKFQQKRNLKLQDGIVGIETQGAMAPICRGEETGATTPVVDLSA